MHRKASLNSYSQGLLLIEIEQRCLEILIGAELLEDWVSSDADVSRVWFALRSIINAAANISQLVGGPSGDKATERRELRKYLQIRKGSALHDSMLRHHSEHLDDRIRRAQAGGAPLEGMGYGYGAGRIHGHRWLHGFDTATGIVYFYGGEVSIPKILAEARRMLPLITAILKPSNVVSL